MTTATHSNCLPQDDNNISPWIIGEEDLCPGKTAGYETIFAQANGYRCFRGTSPLLTASQPGNFIAGIFDQSEAPVTELVNAPNPLPITVYLDYEALELGHPGLTDYARRFDLESGIVSTTARFRSGTGAELDVRMERLVSHADRSRWAERWQVTARNFSRRILIRVAIDGDILSGQTHPLDATKHFQVLAASAIGDDLAAPAGIILVARTRDQGIEIAEAQTLSGSDKLRLIKVRPLAQSIEAVWELALTQGETLSFERLGVTCSSRDADPQDKTDDGTLPALTAERAKLALRAFVTDGYKHEKTRHQATLLALWQRIDIVIDGDPRAQRGLRYNLFQLACCASPDDERVSIGAKGLHGEGYKGHVFWDTETFMLPFFIFTQPEVARNLLRYRCRTLAGARANAAAGDYAGARFPWEAADDGRETTPQWGVDYAGNHVRIWTGDIEVHINADITYAILKYYQVSGDEGFMQSGGLRLLLEIARFWISFVTYNPSKDRYEILNVIGPDEFHEHDVNNNTYTNYLTKWALLRTVEIAEKWHAVDTQAATAVMQEAGVAYQDFTHWIEVAHKLHIPIDAKSDLIEQFEGYFKLKEYPITEWDANGMPVWPKGVDVAKLGTTTLIKQADVVMLFALLGEEFSRQTKLANYEFYEARTMHKSSLSPSIYAMVGMSIGKTEHAYDYFMKAVETDLVDNQGNNAQGIHSANMGGVWQTAVFGFGGLSVDGHGHPCLDPWLPAHWTGFRYRFVWRGINVEVEITPKTICVTPEAALDIVVCGKPVSCAAGVRAQLARG